MVNEAWGTHASMSDVPVIEGKNCTAFQCIALQAQRALQQCNAPDLNPQCQPDTRVMCCAVYCIALFSPTDAKAMGVGTRVKAGEGRGEDVWVGVREAFLRRLQGEGDKA